MANLNYPSDTQMRAPTEYLDDISIYNRALTQQEITSLYTATSTNAYRDWETDRKSVV